MPTEVPPTGVWWHVYALGFLNAEREALPDDAPVAHRLQRLLPWLDYAAGIGLEGVVLGPVFASETHGYDTVDHLQVDRRLGDEGDLIVLLDHAHALGLRVVLDGVFNHVGRTFGPFRAAMAGGPGSPTAGWFRLTWPERGGEPQADVFEGHEHLVALNHASPQVRDYVATVMEYWCARGVDGWRLDAAYAVPAAFWRPVLDRVRGSRPGLWVFGEVIRGDYVELVDESGMDSVTQYELWKAIGSAIAERNFFELAHALERHAEFLERFVPVTFLGNHDTSRIASRITDRRHLPHAVAVLLAVGGTPVVYAGDEQGFTGTKYDRAQGDDEVRPPFPDHPEQLSRLGEPILQVYRQLIAVRRARPWLASASTAVTHLTNTTMVCVTDSAGRRVAVAVSLDDGEIALPLPQQSWQAVAGDCVLTDSSVTLPGHGWAVLVQRAL